MFSHHPFIIFYVILSAYSNSQKLTNKVQKWNQWHKLSSVSEKWPTACSYNYTANMYNCTHPLCSSTPKSKVAEFKLSAKLKSISTSPWRVWVFALQLLLELSKKDLVALVLSILLCMELTRHLESLMYQKGIAEHCKMVAGNVEFAGLPGKEKKPRD